MAAIADAVGDHACRPDGWSPASSSCPRAPTDIQLARRPPVPPSSPSTSRWPDRIWWVGLPPLLNSCILPAVSRLDPSPSRTSTTATPGPTPSTRRCCAATLPPNDPAAHLPATPLLSPGCWTRRTFSPVVSAELSWAGAAHLRRVGGGREEQSAGGYGLGRGERRGPWCKLSYLSDEGMFSKFMRGQSAKVPRRTYLRSHHRIICRDLYINSWIPVRCYGFFLLSISK
jgi:hypothetical protein